MQGPILILVTLEIRICDLPVRFTDVLGITAMIQALVATLVEEKGQCPPLNQHIIKSNKWQAARYGLDRANGSKTRGRVLYGEYSKNFK